MFDYTYPSLILFGVLVSCAPLDLPPPMDRAELWNGESTSIETLPMALTYQNGQVARFTFNIAKTETHEPTALYIPRLDPRATITFNDEHLRIEDPRDYLWNTPLLFTIPSSLWRTQGNRLAITLRPSRAFGAYLDAPYIGPAQTLMQHHSQHVFLQKTGPLMLMGILLGGALMLSWLWWWRPRDATPLWAAVAMSLWAIHNLNYIVTWIPVPYKVWQIIIFSPLAWLAYACLRFASTYYGLGWPRTDKIIGVVLIGANIAMACSGAWLQQASQAWLLITLGIGLTGCVRLIRHRHLAVGYDAWPVIAAGVGMMLVTIPGLLAQLGLAHRPLSSWAPLGAPGIVLALGLIGVMRFVRALNNSETLTHELEDRVRAREDDLKEAYARERHRDQAEAAQSERHRILTDMHDGVGHQLTVALAIGERQKAGPEVQSAIRTALDEMRFVIRLPETAPHTDDLGVELLYATLADSRDTLERRLLGSGIALEWHLNPTLHATIAFSPQDGMHLYRILQEAITNTIKHSGAHRVVIALYEMNGDPVVSIRDDGRGLGGSRADSRGLNNMRARAKQMGVALQMRSLGGVEIMLSFSQLP